MSDPLGTPPGVPVGPRDSRVLPRRTLAILFTLAAGVAFVQGVAPLLGLNCETCSGGLLSIVLPWAGVAFYGSLAVLALRTPDSQWLSRFLGLYIFVHGSLMLESVLIGRWCLGCMLVALLAAGAGAIQAWRTPADLAALAIGLVLGMSSGFFSPFERVDNWLTRTAWPARVLEAAPPFVNRAEMANCGDAAEVRLIIYEKDCKS
jgi:hypothetical protein